MRSLSTNRRSLSVTEFSPGLASPRVLQIVKWKVTSSNIHQLTEWSEWGSMVKFILGWFDGQSGSAQSNVAASKSTFGSRLGGKHWPCYKHGDSPLEIIH